MKSEPRQIPAAKSCRCRSRPVYFTIDGPAEVVFHRVMCPRCGKKVTSLAKHRAIVRWNEYITEVKALCPVRTCATPGAP